MSAKSDFYRRQAETIIKHMEKRNIRGMYAENAAEACAKALALIQPDTTVAFGGSMTLEEIGLLDTLRERSDIRLLDRYACHTQEEREQLFRESYFSDYYLMSSNAITLDGQLINIDGTGNRVSALIYGPKQVIIIAGMNKVVTSLEEGIARIRNISSPPNCVRLERKTPCAVTGTCGDCYGEDCICNQIVRTRRSAVKNRIQVILTGEPLGY